MKQPYTTPTLLNYGSIKDTTTHGSAPRFCPNGQPRPPTGNCGH